MYAIRSYYAERLEEPIPKPKPRAKIEKKPDGRKKNKSVIMDLAKEIRYDGEPWT